MEYGVECRSDWAYAQRPLAFTWQGRRLVVKAILAEQRTPEGLHFLVSTNEDGNFELIYEQDSDHWTIQPQPAKESA
jgi:hypothetical protein